MVPKTVAFLSAVYDHISQGRTLLTKEQAQQRLTICEACPHFRKNKCTKCGCCATGESNYFNKLAYPNQKCPEGRWGVVEN